jgi:hypothetical protein
VFARVIRCSVWLRVFSCLYYYFFHLLTPSSHRARSLSVLSAFPLCVSSAPHGLLFVSPSSSVNHSLAKSFTVSYLVDGVSLSGELLAAVVLWSFTHFFRPSSAARQPLRPRFRVCLPLLWRCRSSVVGISHDRLSSLLFFWSPKSFPSSRWLTSTFSSSPHSITLLHARAFCCAVYLGV